MLQYGLASKTLSSVKEISHKRPHAARFLLYELYKIGKPTEAGNGLVVAMVGGRKWEGGGRAIR